MAYAEQSSKNRNPKLPSCSCVRRKLRRGYFVFLPPGVCAPDRRLPSAAWHRLGCLLRGATRPRLSLGLCTPAALHLPGAGVPTQGTSHWGHPLGDGGGGWWRWWRWWRRRCWWKGPPEHRKGQLRVLGRSVTLRSKTANPQYNYYRWYWQVPQPPKPEFSRLNTHNGATHRSKQ
jgi:hypothetical protein